MEGMRDGQGHKVFTERLLSNKTEAKSSQLTLNFLGLSMATNFLDASKTNELFIIHSGGKCFLYRK